MAAPVPAAIALLALALLAGAARAQLEVGFYASSCPTAESAVTTVVRQAAASDPTILPALLRLQFHDCFVRGCDASVLVTNGSNVEVGNNKHQGLRGQGVIDAAKAQLEARCPGVVSCADIVALAARDAVAMTGGPSFDVPTGRRDGRVSRARDANGLPDVHDSIAVLRAKFAASGLDDKDLVVLTAAHTIGSTACFFLIDRLYKFPLPGGGTGSDPSISPELLSELMTRCPNGGNINARLPLDRGSETVFDTSILSNIRSGHAVIASDAALYDDSSTRAVVDSYFGFLSTWLGPDFDSDFADALVKMGQLGVLTGRSGEVRRVCTSFN